MKKNKYEIYKENEKIGEAASIKEVAMIVGCSRLHILKQLKNNYNSFSFKKEEYFLNDLLGVRGFIFELSYSKIINELPQNDKLEFYEALFENGFKKTKPSFSKEYLQIIWENLITNQPIKIINENR
jgi:hypothetical protein